MHVAQELPYCFVAIEPSFSNAPGKLTGTAPYCFSDIIFLILRDLVAECPMCIIAPAADKRKGLFPEPLNRVVNIIYIIGTKILGKTRCPG
jgi:hypothetical protein